MNTTKPWTHIRHRALEASIEVIPVWSPKGSHTACLLYEPNEHLAEFSALGLVPMCIYWLVCVVTVQGGSWSTESHLTGLIQFSFLQKYFPGHQRPRANFIWLPIDPFTQAYQEMKREAHVDCDAHAWESTVSTRGSTHTHTSDKSPIRGI